MTRRRVLLLLGLLAVVLGLGAAWLLSPRPVITSENAARFYNL